MCDPGRRSGKLRQTGSRRALSGPDEDVMLRRLDDKAARLEAGVQFLKQKEAKSEAERLALQTQRAQVGLISGLGPGRFR